MKAVTAHLLIGALIAGFCAMSLWGGYVPNTETITEQMPVTVRDNPASYRPTYIGGTGWSPRTTGSGGYSFGK